MVRKLHERMKDEDDRNLPVVSGEGNPAMISAANAILRRLPNARPDRIEITSYPDGPVAVHLTKGLRHTQIVETDLENFPSVGLLAKIVLFVQ